MGDARFISWVHHPRLCLSAGGNHLLGAKLPAYMNATCRTRLLQYVAATRKDNTMSRGNQPSGGTVTLVGMDAHTRVRPVPPLGDAQRQDPRVGVHAHQRHRPGGRLISSAHCVILYGRCRALEQAGSACCIHVCGEFSPKQVVSAGAQTKQRVMNP